MNTTMANTEAAHAISIGIPKPETLSTYYQNYLKYVKEGDDLLELLRTQRDETQQFLSGISESRAGFAYAPGKWQLKEVAGHVCDTERILSYRALRFARKDQTPLSGFEENEYTLVSNYSSRSLKNISDELKSVREATLSLISNFSEEMIDYKGKANNQEVTVRAIIYFIFVHQQHHMQVIRERYLS